MKETHKQIKAVTDELDMHSTWETNVKETATPKLGILKAIIPEGCNAVGPTKEWEEVEFAVDSGASETVVGSDMLESVPTQPSAGSKRGIEYEVANGVTTPNEGESILWRTQRKAYASH